MARPNLDRLNLIGLIGVGAIAVAAFAQLASLLVRQTLLAAILSGVILAIIVVFYFAVARPSVRAWRAVVRRSDERRQRFRAVFEEHPDAIAVYAIDGRITRGNPAAIAMLRYGPDIVGKSWREHVRPSERAEVEKHFQYACSGHVAKFESVFLAANDEEISVTCYLVPTIVNGEVVSVVGTARDVREVKNAQRRERVQTDRIAALATIKSEFASHPQEQIQRLLNFVGESLAMEGGAVSFIGSNVLEVVYSSHNEVRPGLRLDFEKTFARHTYGSREVLAIPDTTLEEWCRDEAVMIQGWRSYIGTTIFVESQPVGILSYTRRSPREKFDGADIDFVRIAAALIGAGLERLRNEAILAKEAHIDRVTGLSNRPAFEDQLRMAIARARRQGGHVRVHFIDLDGFKAVNDSLGHAAGDEVLRVIATRFRALIREDDLVARLGGDEFVVLESTLTDESDSTALGNRIVAAASELMYIGGRIVRIGASVGVAAYPQHAEDEVTLLERADTAMYAAKTAGKGAVKLYSYG